MWLFYLIDFKIIIMNFESDFILMKKIFYLLIVYLLWKFSYLLDCGMEFYFI